MKSQIPNACFYDNMTDSFGALSKWYRLSVVAFESCYHQYLCISNLEVMFVIWGWGFWWMLGLSSGSWRVASYQVSGLWQEERFYVALLVWMHCYTMGYVDKGGILNFLANNSCPLIPFWDTVIFLASLWSSARALLVGFRGQICRETGGQHTSKGFCIFPLFWIRRFSHHQFISL